MSETPVTPSSKPKKERRARPASQGWHLAESDLEARLADFELMLLGLMEAFQRWQVNGFESASEMSLTSSDLGFLQCIRMQERSKGLTELMRLLNREDTANAQYSLRKLEKMKLVEKVKDLSKRTYLYHPTEKGKKVTNAYRDLRKQFIVTACTNIIEAEEALTEVSTIMDLMTGIYDQAARLAIMARQKNNTEK